jgi:hypothetical protein
VSNHPAPLIFTKIDWVSELVPGSVRITCCAHFFLSVLLLAAIGALLAAAVVLTGIVLGTHPGVIAVEVFGSIAAPQFAFVAVRPSHSSDKTDTAGPSSDRATAAR